MLTICGDIAWNGYLGGIGGAATRDRDLGTRDVPLRCTSDVQPDLLDAEQILRKVVNTLSKRSVYNRPLRKEHWLELSY